MTWGRGELFSRYLFATSSTLTTAFNSTSTAAIGRGFYVIDTSTGLGGIADRDLSLLATGGNAYAGTLVDAAARQKQKGPLLAAKSGFSCNREVCATLPVVDHDAEYAIIPCTLEPGFWGAFTLTAYSVEVFEEAAGDGDGSGASAGAGSAAATAAVAWAEE